MSDTSVRTGWNTQPYGRKKFDLEYAMDDLPLILAEHGVPAEAVECMPWSARIRALYFAAEIQSQIVRAQHEARESGWQKGQELPAGAAAAKAERDRFAQMLDAVINPYKAKAPEPAAV